VVLQLPVAAQGSGPGDELVPLPVLRVQQAVLVVLALRLPGPPVDVRHHALDHKHLQKYGFISLISIQSDQIFLV